MKKLIELTESAIKALKMEAEKNGRSLKKHIEMILEQRAVKIENDSKKK